jgi:ABC-type microcin C transport system permease subunit YejB
LTKYVNRFIILLMYFSNGGCMEWFPTYGLVKYANERNAA